MRLTITDFDEFITSAKEFCNKSDQYLKTAAQERAAMIIQSPLTPMEMINYLRQNALQCIKEGKDIEFYRDAKIKASLSYECQNEPHSSGRQWDLLVVHSHSTYETTVSELNLIERLAEATMIAHNVES